MSSPRSGETVNSRGRQPTEPSNQEAAQPRMGLTKPLGLAAPGRPFQGRAFHPFASSVGSHLRLLTVLPLGGGKADLKNLTHSQQILDVKPTSVFPIFPHIGLRST